MQLAPCAGCGEMPQPQTKELAFRTWTRYVCCSAGQSSPSEQTAQAMWNRVQHALTLLKATESFVVDDSLVVTIMYQKPWSEAEPHWAILRHDGTGTDAKQRTLSAAIIEFVERQ